MSGRYRFRRRSGFRRSTRSFVRNNRSTIVRRARGNARAANNQADTTDVTINLMTKCKSGVLGYMKGTTMVQQGVSAINIFELLRKSDFFNSYAPMYDQFRITSIKVKVTPVAWQTYNQWNLPNQWNQLYTKVTPASGNTPLTYDTATIATADPFEPDDVATVSEATPELNKYRLNYENDSNFIFPQALTIVTAWDRTGLDSTQLTYYKNTTDKLVVTIGDAISTYSSAKSSQLVAGANFNCTRYLYPSSQQEKSLYYSTNDLKLQQKYNYSNEVNPYLIDKVSDGTDDKVPYDPIYITNLRENPNCPFKPTFLLGVLSVDKVDAQGGTELEDGILDERNMSNNIKPVTFNLEFDIGVTFRGLRKSQIV